MIWRICGGLGVLLLGFTVLEVKGIPDPVTGVLLVVGGIALLAGR